MSPDLPPRLRPPVRVALARRVESLPSGGRLAYEPKFDGHRVVILRTEDDALLQARSGRLITTAFPDLRDAALRLPAGTALDGEVVVWAEGGTDFAAVQKRAAAATTARAALLARRLPASYAAFDLLAADGEDLRPLPYERRRALLDGLLEPYGPPLQAVPMTTDPELAATWYEALRAIGVEGLVIKRLDQPYREGRHWLKLRHSDTRDAVVVGVVGPRLRPRALALVVPGDDIPVVSGPLSPAVRGRLIPVLRQLPEQAPDPAAVATDTVGNQVAYHPVAPELTVEIQRETTVRHAAATVVRLRTRA